MWNILFKSSENLRKICNKYKQKYAYFHLNHVGPQWSIGPDYILLDHIEPQCNYYLLDHIEPQCNLNAHIEPQCNHSGKATLKSYGAKLDQMSTLLVVRRNAYNIRIVKNTYKDCVKKNVCEINIKMLWVENRECITIETMRARIM